MSFSYIVYTADKEVIKGTLDVHSESLAEETLESAGYKILSLQEIKKRSFLEDQFPSLFGIKDQNVIDFSEQLAIMVGAGIALPSALQQIEEQTESAAFKRVISGLGRELRAGSTFSEALSSYPKVFPDVFCRIVRAGEQSGNIEEALMQAVRYMQRGTAVMKEVKRVLVYPCFIVILAAIVVALMITVAMPPLMGLFSDLDADLPLPTRMLMSFTDFATAFKFHIFASAVVLAGTAYWYFRTPSGRLVIDNMLLKIPGIKSIIIQTNMALFSRTMSVLLNSGVALPQIMEVTQQTTGNRIIRRAIREVQDGIYEGQGLAKPMQQSKVFPSMMVRMVGAGELSGTLDANLAKLADYYEDEANKKINTFVSLLEPAMTVALGLGVGFIAISLIMPMYSMMRSM